MGQQVDLLKEFSEAGHPADQGGLDRVRLGNDEVIVYMFTSIAEKVDIHFCSEADINDFVLCNGKGCILCQIGRNLDQRRLMAVYVPEARAVAVLPVSLSQRPHALLPQLLDVLKIPEPQVVFIRRGSREHYHVEARPIPADCDAGERAISAFLAAYKTGTIQLDSVYSKISNEELARFTAIADRLRLKGIKVE